MLNDSNVLGTIIGVVVGGQLAQIGALWVFWGKVHDAFVPKGECVIRDSGTRELVKIATEQGRDAAAASVCRDSELRQRVNALFADTTTRAIAAVLAEEHVIEKLNEILMSTRK